MPASTSKTTTQASLAKSGPMGSGSVTVTASRPSSASGSTGNQGGSKSSAPKSSTTMAAAKSSNTANAPTVKSGAVSDSKVKNAATAQNNTQTAKSSPALRSDGLKPKNAFSVLSNGGIKGAISAVRQAADTVAKKPISPSGTPFPSGPVPSGIMSLVNKASGILDSSDKQLANRSINSMRPTPTISEMVGNVARPFSLANITKSVYDTGIGAIKGGIDFASDPYGTAKRGIGALGDYAKSAYNQFAAAGMGDEKSIGPAFVTASGLLPTNALIGSVPQNSLAALVGRRSSDPDVIRAYNEGMNMLSMGVPERDVFEKTAKMTPEYASGLQKIVPNFANIPGFERYAIEVHDPYTIKSNSALDRVISSLIGKEVTKPTPLSDIVQYGPTFKSYPELASALVHGDLSQYNPETLSGTLGSWMPAPIGSILGNSSLKNMMVKNNPKLGVDHLDMNVPVKRSPISILAGTYAQPFEKYQSILGHELGHATSAPSRADLYSGANLGAYMAVIQRKDPSLSAVDAKRLARKAYESKPGEFTSRKISDRLNMPEADIKSYYKRFGGSFTADDIQNMLEGYAIRLKYGL